MLHYRGKKITELRDHELRAMVTKLHKQFNHIGHNRLLHFILAYDPDDENFQSKEFKNRLARIIGRARLARSPGPTLVGGSLTLGWTEQSGGPA